MSDEARIRAWASDKSGAYPAENPVRPDDLAATIYHALGIDPHTEMKTTANRPALKDLKAGGYYLDTTLVAAGQPIWVNATATGWVNYLGVAV